MNAYRRVTDPVVQIRICNECRATIAGITDRGLTTWLNIAPVTPEVEVLLHAVGWNTWTVQPRPGRTAWIDWRSPAASREAPHRGIVLADHPHQSPGRRSTDTPAWLIDDYRITAAPKEETECPMF